MQQELSQQHSDGRYVLYTGIIVCYGWESKTYFSVLKNNSNRIPMKRVKGTISIVQSI